MSNTNLTPPVQGLVQQTAEAFGEILQQVGIEIHELEQKSKGAEGKVHIHYQEKLTELHHTHETLEAELTGLRTGEIPRAPTQLVTSPQDLPGLEATVVPVEPETPSASLPKASGSPSLQEGPQPGSEVKAPTKDMGVDIQSLEEGNLAGQQIQEGQAQLTQETPLGSFLAKVQRVEQTKWKRTQKP